MKNLKQIKAVEQMNRQIILNQCLDIPDTSGIYILTREDNGLKYAYIGQAKKLLTRLASHLRGYQHIDISLRKHGLYNSNNETGWCISWLSIPVDKLDKMEKEYIVRYANLGYQLRNKTAGGQGKGKVIIDDIKPSKGYRDGLVKGYFNAKKYASKLFEKHLDCVYKGDVKRPTKNQEKAMSKFKDFINVEKINGNN